MRRLFSRLFCQLDRTYESEVDRFLSDLSHQPLSTSQQRIRQQYDRLTQLRDSVNESQDDSILWDKF